MTTLKAGNILRKKGLSLIELLITVAILAFGLVSILQAISLSLGALGVSCGMTEAVFFAKDKMQEWEFKEAYKLLGLTPLSEKDQEGKFSWEYALLPELSLNLYHLDLDIRWQRPKRQEELKLSTYLRG